MTLTVSAPVKIAAICGLVFTVLVFGGLRLLGTGGGSDTATPHVILHHKFGSGVTKTATAVSVAVVYALEHPGEEVLLGDLDPRGAATKWTGATPSEPGLDMSAILGQDDVKGWADELAVSLDPAKGWPENLRVIPSGFRAQATQETLRQDHAEMRLKRSLSGTRAGGAAEPVKDGDILQFGRVKLRLALP